MDDEKQPESTEASSLCCLHAHDGLFPTAQELPPRPLPAIERNYTQFFITDFLKERHDQYIYKHNNGLCVIGLAPTHVALDRNSSITAVDFNVGKQSRADMKVTGKRKNNARVLEPNSALCKVISNDETYIVRCCVKGALLEVNERLANDPSLLRLKAATEGYVAILMPKPDDWKKAVATFLSSKEYTVQMLGAKD